MMRVVLPCSVLVLFACGGAQKPAADTAPAERSLESTSPSAADSLPAAAPAAHESSETSAQPAAAPSGPSAPAQAAPAATSTVFHPAPSVTGSIDGKPFSPKLARVAAPMQKDGRILLTLSEDAECTSSAKPGDGSLTILVPWQDGYKVDLSALKRPGKKGSGEIAFSRSTSGSKSDFPASFKPSGRLTVVSAPMEKNATGKIKIDLQSGDYMLVGDMDILVCVSPTGR
jgi:hypothetical protein